jgi:hypothetical protein
MHIRMTLETENNAEKKKKKEKKKGKDPTED